MDIRPYLIVPKLIPQPTWGGSYIAEYKSIRNEAIASQKIGQSYELSSDTMLSTVTDSNDLPIEIGDPKTGATIDVIGDATKMFPLQKLIDENPELVLGKKYLEKYGSRMQILIKFTQAKGNSFQVHVVPGKEFGHWKAKPESWFYFKPGKATLGLKPSVDIAAYKTVCLAIEEEAKRLSALVQSGSYTAENAKKELNDCVIEHNPFQFVNEVDIPEGAIIDLSTGGTHHSWEEGDSIPDGNVLYEVQLNVMDNDCTLRSFDKGKIGEDGSIRPIHVDDYFKALDTDPAHNDPRTLIKKASGPIVFESPYYVTQLGMRSNSDSFQHVFVQEKELRVADLTVRKGASLFIPTGYTANPTSEKANVLMTTL